MAKAGKSSKDYASYVVINGKRLNIKQHKTDFSVMSPSSVVGADAERLGVEASEISPSLTRMTASSSAARDGAMDDLRKRRVAHHIYEVQNTGEELVMDDHVFLQMEPGDPEEVQDIIRDFKLVDEGRMGETYVLRVTDATGANPIRTANKIAERQGVRSCSPQLMVPLQRHRSLADTHALFREQWYLTADLINSPNVDPRADVQAPEAWQITKGSRDIVIAVMDDGVDTGHPAFRNASLHPQGRDFADNDHDPTPQAGDFHGTPVASIAVGSGGGEAMIGVAPECTLLPIRIGFGPLNQVQTLKEFRFASRHADVVNCSFGFPPLSFDIFDAGFRQEINEITRTGGRRGKGLVIVFSAGNDDAPTELKAAENVNGVRFLGGNPVTGFFVREIPAGDDVFSAYPSINGVVVVAAMSSMLRKSGYSNWGEKITVTAPSDNGHELRNLGDFSANYRGLGQVAASNRPGHGSSSRPLRDDPSTPNVREDFYTDQFGGTSGAAPVVSGIIGLMLSVNPDLTANEVRNILMATADTNLDTRTDLANDPNLQGKTGEFLNGHSLFFGKGKVNALKAVSRAKALRGDEEQLTARVAPGLDIPDNQPQGIVSHLDISASGSVRNISVDVDITHTYRGDLSVILISPQGFSAELHRVFEGGALDDLKRAYRASNTPSLQNLVDGGVSKSGRWTLHVIDNLRRDVGRLNSWSIDLRDAVG